VRLQELLGRLNVKRVKDGGENYQACCPNPQHNERVPSWGISKESPHVHNCFSCGYRGNVLTLVSNALHLNPLDSRRLANEYGYQETKIKEKKEVVLTTINEMILERYTWARPSFIYDRGITKDTAIEWQLGYDSDKKRLVIPIRNAQGELVGLQGRTAINEKPKYYFYDDFKKGSYLFGLNKKWKDSNIYLVLEGTLDCVLCWQHTRTFDMSINPISIMGSHATKKQIELILKYADTVVIGLDNDEAGRDGTNLLVRALKGRVKLFVCEFAKGENDLEVFKDKDKFLAWTRNRKIVL